MIRSQLNSYSGSDPIWGFVALVGTERFTGEAAVGIDPRVRLFAVDGRVYFAEREGDAPVGTRLVNCGAVTTTQLSNGSVQIGASSSLARLFQREPGIDRDAVELTIELATESLLESIANKPVGMPEVFPLRHHSSGIHHWLRSAAPGAVAAVPAPVVEAPVVEAPTESVVEAPVVEAAVVEAPVFEEPVVEAPVVEEPVEPVVEAAVVEAAVIAAAVTEEPVLEAPTEAFVEPAATAAWNEQSSSSWQPDPAVYTPASNDEPTVAEPEQAPAEALHLHALPALTPWAATTTAAAEVDAADEVPVDAAPVVVPELTPSHADAEQPATDEPVVEPVHTEPPATLGLLPLPTFASLTAQPADPQPTVEDATISHPAVEETAEAMPDEHVELAAAHVEVPAAEVPAAMPPTLAPLAPLPTLRSQSDSTASMSSADFFESLPDHVSYEPGTPPPGLPKLANAPIAVSDLPAVNAEPAPAFGGATHNLAAVDIWQMVDVLLDDDAEGDQQLVGAGGAEKRSRGWLRGRKG